MNFPKPQLAPSTPVGAAAMAGAVSTIGMYFLGLWPPFETVPSGVQAACQTVILVVLVYIGGWLKVVTSPQQQVTMELTSTPLPTLQEVPQPQEPEEAQAA